MIETNNHLPVHGLSAKDRLSNMLNEASLAVMVSIGHRTGLFDTMENMQPSTKSEIAEAAGLSTRYVQEWLNAMTVGKILTCKASERGNLYKFAPGYSAALCRSSGTANIAGIMQYVGMMGTVEDKIIECFHSGDGIPYEEYKRVYNILDEEGGHALPKVLFTEIIPGIEGFDNKLQQGIDVLDLGCGNGRILLMLAERYPKSRFTGYDLGKEPIRHAVKLATSKGMRNIRFEVRDLTEFKDLDSYDLITAFDTIHDTPQPDQLLQSIHQALRNDGMFLMQEIAGSSDVLNNLNHPMGPFLYSISCMHCVPVSLAQNGMGFGAMWGQETATAMLQEAGFSTINVKNFEHDMQNNYYILQKNRP